MVSKCANPGCPAAFHYMHEGKLFVVDEHGGDGAGEFRAVPHRLRYFWLCSQCSQTLTVVYDGRGGGRVVPVYPGASECTRTAA